MNRKIIAQKKGTSFNQISEKYCRVHKNQNEL